MTLELDAAAALAALARRCRLPLDVQPHRAVPRTSTRRRHSPRSSQLAGEPLDGVALPAARGRGRPPSLPRRGRARLARARARARSSARCAPRTSPSRPARSSIACSARRSRVGKRVRTETAIGESPASVSSAAAALAAQVFGDLGGPPRAPDRRRADRRARGAQPRLARRRDRVRRQPHAETAHELAQRFGGSALTLDQIARALGEVDVVVSSTSAPQTVLQAGDVPGTAARTALLHRHRGAARPRRDDRASRRLLPLRHRRSRSGRRRDARRTARRGRARRAARRRGGRALPRVACVARRRSGDRIAARARRGDPGRRAREAERTRHGRRAPHARVGDLADPEQAPAPADHSDEGGGCERGRGGVRRRGPPPLRAGGRS